MSALPTRSPMASAPKAVLFEDYALGATWYGYQTLWLNRYHLPFEQLGTQPSRIGPNLRAVLDFFPN